MIRASGPARWPEALEWPKVVADGKHLATSHGVAAGWWWELQECCGYHEVFRKECCVMFWWCFLGVQNVFVYKFNWNIYIYIMLFWRKKSRLVFLIPNTQMTFVLIGISAMLWRCWPPTIDFIGALGMILTCIVTRNITKRLWTIL